MNRGQGQKPFEREGDAVWRKSEGLPFYFSKFGCWFFTNTCFWLAGFCTSQASKDILLLMSSG